MSSFRYSPENPKIAIEVLTRELRSGNPSFASKTCHQLAQEIVDVLSELVDDAGQYDWSVGGDLVPRTEDRVLARALANIMRRANGTDDSPSVEPAKLYLHFTARKGSEKKFFRRTLDVDIPVDDSVEE